jgi:hypothetical protein
MDTQGFATVSSTSRLRRVRRLTGSRVVLDVWRGWDYEQIQQLGSHAESPDIAIRHRHDVQ